MHPLKQLMLTIPLGMVTVFLSTMAYANTESVIMLNVALQTTVGTVLVALFLTGGIHPTSTLNRKIPGMLQLLAGATSFIFVLRYLSFLLSNETVPLRNSPYLLLFSLTSIALAWVILKISRNPKLDTYYETSLSTDTKEREGVPSRTSEPSLMAVRKVFSYGLTVALGAGCVGMVALYIENLYGVRTIDVIFSFSVGLGMLIRGLLVVTE